MKRLTRNRIPGEMALTMLYRRLKAIEDILGEEYTLADLRKIVEAERDGRLVVLPCKIGDTVWVTGTGGAMKCEIDEACFDRTGLVFMVSFNCEKDWTNYYEACKGCPFNSWHQDYSGEWSCDGEWGQASIKGSDFGKTVFLTREEAEKALAKEAGK